MAQKVPFFLTGANARILLNNRTVAFATDVSYNIAVKHASPHVLGRFEAEVHQPLAYDVTGTMTIIRYARGIDKFLGQGAPADASPSGNGMGSFSRADGAGGFKKALGLPVSGESSFDGAADEALNPSRFFQSKMFNIEIRQKLGGNDETTVVMIRDCRIESFSFDLSKRGAAVQRLQFKARYADDDTFIARKSGVGQELS